MDSGVGFILKYLFLLLKCEWKSKEVTELVMDTGGKSPKSPVFHNHHAIPVSGTSCQLFSLLRRFASRGGWNVGGVRRRQRQCRRGRKNARLIVALPAFNALLSQLLKAACAWEPVGIRHFGAVVERTPICQYTTR